MKHLRIWTEDGNCVGRLANNSALSLTPSGRVCFVGRLVPVPDTPDVSFTPTQPLHIGPTFQEALPIANKAINFDEEKIYIAGDFAHVPA